ncbi:hypothetical protein OH77DRAFT_1429877 [Trametes cingulata]|nr:hypothetical protein OH77DRAFT_1429877 [Trametes cingulata]
MKDQVKRERTQTKLPYARKPSRGGLSQASALPTFSNPGTSPSDAPSMTHSPSSAAIPFRDICLDNIRERYPDFTPRNDWDILQLASRPLRKGTQKEIYAWLDETYAREKGNNPNADDNLLRVLNTRMEATGKKPRPGDKLVYIRPIPDSAYSIRLYPGAVLTAEYCMDFVETATGKAVNSPFEFELWNIPNPETPWLGMPASGKLRSIERAHGIRQEDILPGEEKFILRDGQTCMLTRPGKRAVWFTVPVRPQPAAQGMEDMDKIDFPKLAVA